MAELHDVETLGTSDHGRVRRTRRSWGRRILTTVGIMVGLVILLIASLVAYVAVQERRSPSGAVFVQTGHGKVELQLPQTVVAPPTPASASLVQAGPAPPTDLVVPRLGLHAQIYLMAQTPPKAAVVGWMYGSAMPGTAGNTVLYGARAGPYAVFDKLDTVNPGDEVTLAAGTVAYVYRVTSITEVAANDTSVLLPTPEPTVTLITDAGNWDPAAGHYTQRLVVRGRYISARAWSGS